MPTISFLAATLWGVFSTGSIIANYDSIIILSYYSIIFEKSRGRTRAERGRLKKGEERQKDLRRIGDRDE